VNLTEKQLQTKEKIEAVARLLGLDPAWAVAVAMTESSLGLQQKSPTGCKGVFQMSSIAMTDLLLEMEGMNDDWIDILCGLAFLSLLFKRWKNIEDATLHFCDPRDREFYLNRVKAFQEEFERMDSES
jgi:hypothetical protein